MEGDLKGGQALGGGDWGGGGEEGGTGCKRGWKGGVVEGEFGEHRVFLLGFLRGQESQTILKFGTPVKQKYLGGWWSTSTEKVVEKYHRRPRIATGRACYIKGS